MNGGRPRKCKRLSVLTRVGRFFEKWLCCGKKFNCSKKDLVNIYEFLSEYRSDIDNSKCNNVCDIKNDRNKLINYGDDHYYTSDPRNFKLRDFFDIELVVLKPKKDNFDDEQFCKLIVVDLIDKTLKTQIKKHVSFLEIF